MTLCIGVITRDSDDGVRIVLCSDTQMSMGFTGSNSQLLKTVGIGYGWVAHFSGIPGCAKDAIERIALELDQVPRTSTFPALLSAIANGLRSYADSPLFQQRAIELLLTGFFRGRAVLLMVDQDLQLHHMDLHCCIGEGAAAATLMLNYRDCGNQESLERVVYYAYEAKKFAESVSSVGRRTFMFWIRALAADAPKNHIQVSFMTPDGMQRLHDQFRASGLQPVPAVLPFDEKTLSDGYVSLPADERGLKSPKRGRKVRPPSRA